MSKADELGPSSVEGGIFNPELLLVNWTSTSFVLLTASLLFYHMTIVRSLEMPKRTAGIFAASLIILALIYLAQALFVYVKRIKRMNVLRHRSVVQEELKISRLYFLTGVILVVVQTGIGITILKGSFRLRV